jgi:isopropylmalate/homocitrate/citramalate synthase
MDTYTRPWPRSTPHSADNPATLRIYDTTLRDGTQREGISLSVDDKIRIAMRLDELGVAYIEGGWPGSNPKDVEFFSRARDLEWLHARLTAFGATCPAGGNPEDDPNLRALLDSGAPVCTIVGKASLFHVREVLRTTAYENLRMISDSVSYLVGEARSVVFDAEVANMAPDEHAPYVGRSAFAHKGGLHAAAMRRDPRSYQHVEPTTVGNRMRVVVSELAGRGSLLSKAEELGITIYHRGVMAGVGGRCRVRSVAWLRS